MADAVNLCIGPTTKTVVRQSHIGWLGAYLAPLVSKIGYSYPCVLLCWKIAPAPSQAAVAIALHGKTTKRVSNGA